MSNSVHGHEVMHFMLEKEGESFSKESLKEAIEARFGADARFHTCSADGMAAEQLIDFLSAKEKFVETGSGFNTRADMICTH
jgi:probable metal-binding protein